MQHNLGDIGGARELAMHRNNVAKDDLEAAEMNLEMLKQIIMLRSLC